MDPNTQKQSIIDRLKQANNILVTVSKNPSVDQLAAAIGFTLGLNKIGKHGIAVFSGEVPSTIEFLKPEETFEKNTDSLRDFIISLDKAKADKLRYKVEDEMVKIFITPYRTSLSDKDLIYSQGDFNVEAVVAFGVRDQQDLDAAITAQGRILHDATVIDINTDVPAGLGTLSWVNPKASSLCEMALSLLEPMKAGVVDAQMATALLTGIVAQTERFSNERTTPETMQASSKLMAAGANQQLVAVQLEPPAPVPEPEPEPESQQQPAPQPQPTEAQVQVEVPEVILPEAIPEPEPTPPNPNNDGSLEISHGEEKEAEKLESNQPEKPEEEVVSQIIIDDQGHIRPEGVDAAPVLTPIQPPSQASTRGMTLQPPTLGGQLTANTETEKLDPSTDILGDGAAAPSAPILSHVLAPTNPDIPPPPVFEPPQTLAKLEEVVSSPHVQQAAQAAGSTDVVEPSTPPPVPPPMMPPSFGVPTPGNDTGPNTV